MSQSKRFDQIMREITGGLSGDAGQDVEYLNQMIEKYQEHPLGDMIIKELSRMIYNLLPEEERESFFQAVRQEGARLQLAVQAAMYQMKNKKYLQARELLAKELKRYERMYAGSRSSKVDLYCMEEPFDRTLYSFYGKGGRELQTVEIPFALAYYTYAVVMERLNQTEAARRALDKGLSWNPFSAPLHLQRAELLGREIDELALLEGSKTALLYAYKPALVARCYANFGSYFMRQDKNELAIGCFMMCQQFEENNEEALKGLRAIYDKTEGTVLPPDIERLKELAAGEDLPLGANRDVVGLAYTYGRHFFNEKQDGPTRYFLSIAYGLTGDKEVKKVLDSMDRPEGRS